MSQGAGTANGDGASMGRFPPIVINLGKTRRKRIKQLQRGRGRLVDEVRQAVEEVRASLNKEMQDKEYVPVILIYKNKKRKRGRGGLLPFF